MTKIVDEILHIYYGDLSGKCKKVFVKFLKDIGYEDKIINSIMANVDVVTYIGLPEKLIEKFGHNDMEKETNSMYG